MQYKLIFAIASLAFVAAAPGSVIPDINSPGDGIGNTDTASAAVGAISGAIQSVNADGNGIGNDNQAEVQGNNIHVLDVEHGTVSNGTASYDPFPSYEYTGNLRPAYPLSPKRAVPDHIAKPDYARDGIPRSEQSIRGSTQIKILTKEEQEGMRVVCRLAREVLDIAASHLKVGITTDEIDAIVHQACLERNAYPSPLNYNEFPKSVCTSVNEVICHGIPDKRALEDGDIVNLDVTLYYNGFHGDLNETYLVGNVDEDGQRLVRTARECLEKAIAMVKPGLAFRDLGKVIEQHAKANNTSVVRTYCGHGIHRLFHCVPNIPHYTKNKAIGIAKPGMCFTIEPMINLGTFGDVLWPDHWTAATRDGQRSAQFEQTLLVTESGVEVLTARKS